VRNRGLSPVEALGTLGWCGAHTSGGGGCCARTGSGGLFDWDGSINDGWDELTGWAEQKNGLVGNKLLDFVNERERLTSRRKPFV
jgi:hypothetical protein